MRATAFLMLGGLIFFCRSYARATAVQKEYGAAAEVGKCGMYRFEFGTERISVQSFDRYVHFVPHLAISRTVFMHPHFEKDIALCVDGQKPYLPCENKRWSSENFFENADANLNIDKGALDDFAAMFRKSPKELHPLLRSYWQDMKFYYELGRRELAFYKSWDARMLKDRVVSVVPSAAAVEVVKKIETAKSRDEKFDLMRKGWRPAMIRAYRGHRKRPEESWSHFLDAYGIKETFIPLMDCDSTGD